MSLKSANIALEVPDHREISASGMKCCDFFSQLVVLHAIEIINRSGLAVICLFKVLSSCQENCQWGSDCQKCVLFDGCTLSILVCCFPQDKCFHRERSVENKEGHCWQLKFMKKSFSVARYEKLLFVRSSLEA